jgi:hypothetical protein
MHPMARLRTNNREAYQNTDGATAAGNVIALSGGNRGMALGEPQDAPATLRDVFIR